MLLIGSLSQRATRSYWPSPECCHLVAAHTHSQFRFAVGRCMAAAAENRSCSLPGDTSGDKVHWPQPSVTVAKNTFSYTPLFKPHTVAAVSSHLTVHPAGTVQRTRPGGRPWCQKFFRSVGVGLYDPQKI